MRLEVGRALDLRKAEQFFLQEMRIQQCLLEKRVSRPSTTRFKVMESPHADDPYMASDAFPNLEEGSNASTALSSISTDSGSAAHTSIQPDELSTSLTFEPYSQEDDHDHDMSLASESNTQPPAELAEDETEIESPPRKRQKTAPSPSSLTPPPTGNDIASPRVPKSRKPKRSTLIAAATRTQLNSRHRPRDAFGDKLPSLLFTGDAFEFELPDFIDEDEEAPEGR
ncbi:hypothetical protein C8R44DRAFT_855535 [Mycena epipterygia]|nr:hypothetical protein C8R44DRAFT_855535 [Mycena epipterygia]